MSKDNLSSPPAKEFASEEFVASRVTILDAHEIDHDLLQIIKFKLTEVLKHFPSWVLTKFSQEIDALLNLFMLQQCLLKHRATFVQKMFQLKYADASCAAPYKLHAFAVSSVLSDYVKRKSDEISIYLRNRNKKAYLTYKYLDIALDMFKLVNFLIFLNQGQYYSILERVLKLNLVAKTKAPRSIEYNYLSRELLYQSIAELLVVLIPLLNSHLLQRKFTNLFVTQKSDTSTDKGEVAVFTSKTRCNVCKQFPWQPHHIECRHVFCYFCLVTNCKLSDNQYECCICSYASPTIHSFAIKSPP